MKSENNNLNKDNEGRLNDLENKRHTLAHILASVCQDQYVGLQLTLGPAVDNGFYYDIDFKSSIAIDKDGNQYVNKPNSEEDLQALQKEMEKRVKAGGVFTHEEVSYEKAKEIFANNKYKLELIDEINNRKEKITIYTINFNPKGDLSGSRPLRDSNSVEDTVRVEGVELNNRGSIVVESNVFIDLCRGGHCDDIADIEIGSFRLDKIAGAYWRGDEKCDMLTRIYGLAFDTTNELDTYVANMEEAKKRDHRVLGRELGLFIFSDLVGPGLPLWTPRGTVLRREIDNFVQSLRSEYNYQAVSIPHITKSDLYKKSGHWEKYAEDLFKINTRDGHVLCMKPMNCPHHTQIYVSELRSYKELPIRYSETTMVYRDEQSGELNGLSRVLSITQDDAHIFCRESQLEDEINSVWNLIEKFYSTFGFTNLTPRFSKRDDDIKYKGSDDVWTKAERAIENLLEKRAKGKWIDGSGEAAFYGPKIDFMAEDAIGRMHQVGTIQIDYVQPTNFGLEYVDEEGKRDMPVMIHCAVAGSLERFISVYIEHTAGAFPLWLAPMQVKVIPIKNEAHLEYAQSVYERLRSANIRVELDDDKNGLGKKVRHAKEMKYPYWIVIGDAEVAGGTVTLESREGEKFTLSIDDLLSKLNSQIVEKK